MNIDFVFPLTINEQTHIHTNTHFTHTNSLTRTHTNTVSLAYTHMHTRARAYTHKCTQMHTNTHKYTHMHTRTRTHTPHSLQVRCSAVSVFATLTTLSHGRFRQNGVMVTPPGVDIPFDIFGPLPHPGGADAAWKLFDQSLRVEDVSAYL